MEGIVSSGVENLTTFRTQFAPRRKTYTRSSDTLLSLTRMRREFRSGLFVAHVEVGKQPSYEGKSEFGSWIAGWQELVGKLAGPFRTSQSTAPLAGMTTATPFDDFRQRHCKMAAAYLP